MMRAIVLVASAGIALGACHKRDAAATLDAGAEARARTAAKTNADLAAADAASARPLPRPPAVRPERATPRPAASPEAENVADRADPNL